MAGERGNRGIAAELIAVARAMREVNCIRYLGHGLELVLGPTPLTEEQVKKANKEALDPLARKRAHFENLLGRTVSNDELKHLPES